MIISMKPFQILTLLFFVIFVSVPPLSAQESVVYYPYTPVYAQPAYARPSSAALGPWPWNLNIGGGPTSIVGGTQNHLTGGWNFTFGTGYNFSPRTGFVLEFMDNGLGLTDADLRQNQATSGDAELWGLTLNPIWRYRIAGPVGGYIIGGGGFYELEKRYTQPFTAFVPTRNGGYDVDGYQNFRQFDDTGGVNIGTGLTCNMGWGTKLFLEVRYHYVFTSGTPTQIIPVTIGFRW